jgi:hypothetical protein
LYLLLARALLFRAFRLRTAASLNAHHSPCMLSSVYSPAHNPSTTHDRSACQSSTEFANLPATRVRSLPSNRSRHTLSCTAALGHCLCFFFCDLCFILPLHHSARLSASFCTPECAIHNSQTLTSFCHSLVTAARSSVSRHDATSGLVDQQQQDPNF